MSGYSCREACLPAEEDAHSIMGTIVTTYHFRPFLSHQKTVFPVYLRVKRAVFLVFVEIKR